MAKQPAWLVKGWWGQWRVMKWLPRLSPSDLMSQPSLSCCILLRKLLQLPPPFLLLCSSFLILLALLPQLLTPVHLRFPSPFFLFKILPWNAKKFVAYSTFLDDSILGFLCNCQTKKWGGFYRGSLVSGVSTNCRKVRFCFDQLTIVFNVTIKILVLFFFFQSLLQFVFKDYCLFGPSSSLQRLILSQTGLNLCAECFCLN